MKRKKKIGIDVMHGMADEILASSKPNYFSCVVTSPPYNTGQDYGPDFNDNKKFDDYLRSLDGMFYSVFKVLRPDGLFFLNIGNCHSDGMGFLKAHVIASRVCKIGFKQVEEIVWLKSITVPNGDGKLHSMGHFTPVKGKRLNPLFEYIFVFAKTDKYKFNREALYVPYADKSNVGRYAKTDGRCIGDVWFIAYPTIGQTKKKKYPAQFPVELAKRCIKLSPPGPVLDPMCGGGATGVAAMQLKRPVVLIDQNEAAVKISKKRLESYRKKMLKKQRA